ncbi:MAG: hypothetical protein ACKO6N_17715 [Myxococcota bacterium]
MRLRSPALWTALLCSGLLLACGKKEENKGTSGAGAPEGAPESAPVAAPAKVEKSPDGLVLGLRHADGSLNTYWVRSDAVTRLGAGLAVPRASGWWVVQRFTPTDTSGKFQEAALATGPAGKKLEPPKVEDMAGCTQEKKLDVLFVGNDHVTVEVSQMGMCEGAAHPSQDHSINTYALDELDQLKPVSAEALLGQEGLKLLVAAGEAALKDKEYKDCVQAPGSAGWGLSRKEGAWRVQGASSAVAGACRGMLEVYPVELKVPEKLTGKDVLPQAFTAYGERAGTQGPVVDVVASPDGKLEVTLEKGGIGVWDGGVRTASLAVEGATLVMAQWAVGEKNATRWATEAQKALMP